MKTTELPLSPSLGRSKAKSRVGKRTCGTPAQITQALLLIRAAFPDAHGVAVYIQHPGKPYPEHISFQDVALHHSPIAASPSPAKAD